MPHLVVELTRYSLDRRLQTLPIETDANGAPLDILAPPFPIRRSLPTPLGIVRVQLVVRTVGLQPVVGSGQSSLALSFDEGSVEFLSSGQSESLLAGNISIPFPLRFTAVTVASGQQARLVADFSGTAVAFAFDAASKARLVAKFGQVVANLAEAAIAAALSAQFDELGAQPAGVNFNLTPGVPSERLLTVEALPRVVWVNADTLALSLRYAPEPVPPPFQPVPFLPPGQPSAFGLRLSNDGFQRTVRNPAVRRLARDMLSARIIDRFVSDVWLQRGGTGPVTAQDRAEGKKRLNDYLLTPAGLAELAAETPAPVGTGKLRKRVQKVPDPFSDFDVEVPELDLWLGNAFIEGRARVTGEVNGFGLTANVRFRARPVLVHQPLSIEMHDIQIDDPDIEINLPAWLKWAFGTLVDVIAGPVIGVIAGFVLSSIVESLMEAFIPSDLGSQVPPPDPQAVTGLPQGVTLTQLIVVPEFLARLGRWSFSIEDPRPFYPRVMIVDDIVRTQVGPEREGKAWFSCLGALGFVADSNAQWGTSFQYGHRSYRSSVTARLESSAVPLPLTRFPWTIAIGHRSLQQYHFPIIKVGPQPLVPGTLNFTTDVWHPEPPLRGSVASATFSIGVQSAGEDAFTLEVPVNAGCIIIELSTKIIDAAGVTWNPAIQIDVPNETVSLGADFDDFTSQCESGRREFQWVDEPSRLDKVWYPPDLFADKVRHAIRTEQPAVTTAIAIVLEDRGRTGLNLILAPSIAQRT